MHGQLFFVADRDVFNKFSLAAGVVIVDAFNAERSFGRFQVTLSDPSRRPGDPEVL